MQLRANCISGDSVEAQPTALVRADLIPHLDMPGVRRCQEWLCFGKPVEKGEPGVAPGPAGTSLGTEGFKSDVRGCKKVTHYVLLCDGWVEVRMPIA